MSEAQPTESPMDFQIHKVYIEDLSFESPHSPAIFQSQWSPEANLDVHTESKAMGDNHYKTVLRMTIEAKVHDKVAFLCEIKCAGIFGIQVPDKALLAQILGSYCPTQLFPYARDYVANMVRRGGFPELNIAPINFDALYAQTLANQQQVAETAE